MNILNKLERRFGKYAVPNLMYYIIILYGAGFVLFMVNPQFFSDYLSMSPQAIMRGQIWRLVTFIMQPESGNVFMTALILYVYYLIGSQLERVLGTFRFNFFYFSGIFFHILVAMLMYFLTGLSLPIGILHLNTSMFLVYATLFPDAEFRIWFTIPIKGKWLAMAEMAFLLFSILRVFLPAYNKGLQVLAYMVGALEATAALVNFFLFFLLAKSGVKYAKHKREFKKKVRQAKPMDYGNGAKHKCAVCGRTELDGEGLEFRYCSKCNGNYEYCQDHLFTHTHVK